MSDRITVAWSSDDQAIAEAFTTHGDTIAEEVLAVSVLVGEATDAEPLTVDGHVVQLVVSVAQDA